MIVRREEGRLWLFMQTDHARVAGTIIAHWGNETFAAPVERQRVAQAIVHHDDGWLDWETHPRVNRKTDRPFHFMEMPGEETLDIWYRGPKIAGDADPYRGILASMHGSWLFSAHPAGKEYTPEQQTRVHHYLADQSLHRERLAARLTRVEPEVGPQLLGGLDHAYQLLQLSDNLSLRFCAQPLAEGRLEGAPRRGMDDLVTLQVSPLDRYTLAMTPWPFDTQEILLPFPYYDLPDRRYTTWTDLSETLRSAGLSVLTVRLTMGKN